MRNRAFLKVVLLGLLTFALAPGLAGAASQGQDLTGMLASSAAERATAASGPVINITPSSHDFGRVLVPMNSGNSNFTVKNTGDAMLNITAVNHSNPGIGFSASLGSLPVSIAPNGTATLVTSYTASGSGLHSDNVTLVSNANSGSPTILLLATANHAPVFSPPLQPNYSAAAFAPFSLTASATDAEGDLLSWTIASAPVLPVGATFDGGTGKLDWTPNASDAGNYAVTITVSDGAANTLGSFGLHVTADNLQPTANPGGPYFGLTNIPLSMDGSGSSDPDGVIASYAWDFGDNTPGGTGPKPSHTYTAAGNYIVSLTVTDNGATPLSHTALTSASIANFIAANIVRNTTNPIRTTGNRQELFGIETPSRQLTDINTSSIRMSTTFPNAGNVSEIQNTDTKDLKIGDIDANGFFDLDVHFKRSALKDLLLHVPNGTTVELVITARTSGDNVPVRGTINVVKSGPGQVVSAAAPNPFRQDGTAISYRVGDNGPVSVRIYSVNGQLVRSLREEFATPGAYEVRWNGRDDGGRVMPSGIYFVSVKQGLEASTTRVVLAR
jgi:chitodextrinase